MLTHEQMAAALREYPYGGVPAYDKQAPAYAIWRARMAMWALKYGLALLSHAMEEETRHELEKRGLG